MKNLTSNQQIIVGSRVKNAVWLFKIGSYQWSTQAITWESENYEFKIVRGSFSGIKLNRAKSELGIQTVDTVTFNVVNADGSLDPEDFHDQRLVISLLLTGYDTPESDLDERTIFKYT